MAPTKPAAAGAPKQKMKQGTLFSFFAKKPEKTTAMTGSSSNNNNTSSSTNTSSQQKQQKKKRAPLNPEIAKITVGSFIEVYWEDDDAYYKALVEEQRSESTFYLKYEIDNTFEWLDLTNERFRRVGGGGDENNNKRRRTILQDDDDDEKSQEEFEFDDDASANDDEQGDDEDDDEDNQWMESDDEEVSNKNMKKPSKVHELVVTGHQAPTSSDAARRLSVMAAKKTPQQPAATMARAMTPRQITPPLPGAGGGGSNASQTTTTNRSISSPPFTPAAATAKQGQQTPAALDTPPMYEKGAVNPAGSHVHNHLQFLQEPRDAKNRKSDHPDYDPRTLKVIDAQFEKHGEMTEAVKQWWYLKSQYFDTVLLFKVGNFYEMKNMDADVGVEVGGLRYIKGHMAQASLPQLSYGPMADKLVRAGYKVARVEQTETLAMLQERKKKFGRGSKNSPKVVNREVCSILTLGTRTFCYLDDQKGILAGESSSGAGSSANSAVGPLLVIREVLLDASTTTESDDNDDDDKMDVDDGNDDNDDQVKAVVEYGITVVDAVRGEISIGQFADDCLRSRMNTLLSTFIPSEIILQGGENGASQTLQSLIRAVQQTSQYPCRVEVIRQVETFPKSTATDNDIRRKMERKKSEIHPWDVKETLEELHRRKYYSAASKKQQPQDGDGAAASLSVSRWPNVLRAAVEGNAELALSSFGAALFYLQRNLIDAEILSMQKVKAYIPPTSSVVVDESVEEIRRISEEQNRRESAIAEAEDGDGEGQNGHANGAAALSQALRDSTQSVAFNEQAITHLALDGTTIRNLELLQNTVDNKVNGSLWSKIDHTVTAPGRRLLRAWLLRPLFRKADIARRADAVEELTSGAAANSANKARKVLSKCGGDIERLLSRVHSMSGATSAGQDDEEGSGGPKIHPNDRAVLYEHSAYTKRKVGDFSKVLQDLQKVAQVPELFNGVEIQSGLLQKVVRPVEEGGCFPDMVEDLQWFVDNFDIELAQRGLFEPARGVDERFDTASATIEGIEDQLLEHKRTWERRLGLTSTFLWKYVNIDPNSKDKYMIELPAGVGVPDYFLLKGKRGSGRDQINKYRTHAVEQLVQQLEPALEIQAERKALGMELIFAKFNSMRDSWSAASQAVAILDALMSLAQTSSKLGYCRPTILDCPPDAEPSVTVIQGRHPCVEDSPNSSGFVPNDLSLGAESSHEKVLLLSGPNMGGKSTLLRQTCLIAILAQIGCSVPAEECSITPIDRIYTRLGASDRILMGHSTFFVELAECAAALRGSTRRSLVIMDELGRGTSTFDGTALASAAVQHLVERSKCLCLFATHYHSLLAEWKGHNMVRLGHMECLVGNGEEDTTSEQEQVEADNSIRFLYTLGEGTCPKSFGINVARLADLPEGVLQKAKRISSEFEQEMNSGNGTSSSTKITANTAPTLKEQLDEAIQNKDWSKATELWKSLQ